MKFQKILLILTLTFLLQGCKQDWLARIGLSCYMEGKLCVDSFEYSHSVAQWLVLTSNKKEYRIETTPKYEDFLLDCKVIDNENTACVMQQSMIPIEKWIQQCEGKMDILKLPKSQWILKYYLITYNSQSDPPYSVSEMNKQKLSEMSLDKWADKQLINEKQEVFCGG